MATWRTSRSEIIAAQRCPRLAWYSRFFGGTGISRKRTSLPLAFGSAFHAGCEKLLMGDVEGAVAAAHLYLNLAFSNEVIDVVTAAAKALETMHGNDEEAHRSAISDLNMTEEMAYAVEEQKAIVEGLIRGWWAKDGERFLRDFEVIEVEREGEAALTRCFAQSGPEAPDIVLQFRPDALVRERQSGDHYLVSWKTTSMAGSWTMAQASTDMQSMSEAFGVEQQSGIRVEGILYLIAVKGQRKKDEYVGAYRQNSPLAYGWMRKGATEEDTEWAWKYGWDTEEINPKTGKAVGTKLGKGFRLVPIWSEYPGGVKSWINDLAAQRIAPRHLNALDGAFPQSLPISRRADEIESWRRQVVAQETRTKSSIADMQESPDFYGKSLDDLVDIHFPQHTHSCFRFNSKCEFFEACWNPAVKADPMASGLYQIRVPNHPTEENSDDE